MALSSSGEAGADKAGSKSSGDMIKAGGSGGENSGPTGSSRAYPKSSSNKFSADFDPMKDKKRGATDWAVGGV